MRRRLRQRRRAGCRRRRSIASLHVRVFDLPRHIEELKRWNPGLISSEEEEMDEETMAYYDEARLFSDCADDYKEFKAWVRSE
jgi:hypothetical protein